MKALVKKNPTEELEKLVKGAENIIYDGMIEYLKGKPKEYVDVILWKHQSYPLWIAHLGHQRYMVFTIDKGDIVAKYGHMGKWEIQREKI